MSAAASTPTTTSDAPKSAAISTLPSGQPIDSSFSSSAPSSPPKKIPIGQVVSAIPSNVDAFLAHLHRCLQTRAGTDAVLLFLTYTSRLAGTSLQVASRSALRLQAQRLVALAFKLPPSTTVVLSSATPPPATALALRLGAKLNAFSALLSDVRMFGRLWGLLGLYFAAKALVMKARAEKDPEKRDEARFDGLLACAKVASLVSFQAAENLAYLSAKKVFDYAPATQAKFGKWSVRSWALYIGLELGGLLVERARRQSQGGAAVQDKTWLEEWKKSFSRNLAWAPLTVHFSVNQPFLPDILVPLFACYPAVGGMRDLWKSTA